MRKIHPMASLFALACLLAAGCVSEAELRMRRIEQNPQIYSQLSLESQARVREGRIAIGDSTGAAWLAFGDPATKSVQLATNGTYEVWNYFRTVPEYYQELVPPVRHPPPPPPPPPGPGMRHYRPPPPPPVEWDWHYEERVRYVDQLKMQLLFNGGACIGIFGY